ncbi:hypothetical protein ES288_A11G298700v1 [Gossypium darwinii]|uniref:DUF4283 domain-containing protein n=1 Tax=Gossypium darwinii TaxID=34276 RepID=A0A5D2EQT1_GOSDA|nr:hypothetical protein ES288_A11G298700v1 [Gossypium darwinii]
MAKQFGDFLGKFLEYDPTVLTLAVQKYMHIRVRLDVFVLLKRKKKIQIGKDTIVYACFQYEKLSLFCFIYEKLGHGESFCPFRLQIEPSNIVFGWDLPLCAVAQRKGMVLSRWLRQTDGSQLSSDNMERSFQDSNGVKIYGSNSRGDLRDQSSNHNLILLKSSYLISNIESINWRNLGSGALSGIELIMGP